MSVVSEALAAVEQAGGWPEALVLTTPDPFDTVADILLHPEEREPVDRTLDTAWFAGLVSAVLHGPDPELRAAVLEAVEVALDGARLTVLYRGGEADGSFALVDPVALGLAPSAEENIP